MQACLTASANPPRAATSRDRMLTKSLYIQHRLSAGAGRPELADGQDSHYRYLGERLRGHDVRFLCAGSRVARSCDVSRSKWGRLVRRRQIQCLSISGALKTIRTPTRRWQGACKVGDMEKSHFSKTEKPKNHTSRGERL